MLAPTAQTIVCAPMTVRDCRLGTGCTGQAAAALTGLDGHEAF